MVIPEMIKGPWAIVAAQRVFSLKRKHSKGKVFLNVFSKQSYRNEFHNFGDFGVAYYYGKNKEDGSSVEFELRLTEISN